MEILLKNNTIGSFRELSYQIQKIQDSVDSVVPDVNDDIGRIANIQHFILLKSKDITSSGVRITGELNISVLYITENEDKVSHLKLSKNISIEYDVPEIDKDAIAQINLQLCNIETRIINPRKLSVNFEICGALSVYVSESIDENCSIPEDHINDLKSKTDTVEMLIPGAVCEKTFAVNEQYTFPSSKAVPHKLLSAKAELVVSDCQHVGNKLIVKGNTSVVACYLSKDIVYPIISEFTSPFSQIIDCGSDEMDNCTTIIELTSSYFDLTETISGDLALDMELHAVIQIVSRKKHCVHYISDTYSNLMPVRNNTTKTIVSCISAVQQERLNIDEKLSVADECQDILCVFPAHSQTVISQNKLCSTIHFDIIYRNKNGSICCVRRSSCVESDELCSGARLLSSRLCNNYIRADEGIVEVKINLEFSYQCVSCSEYSKVCSVELDEENHYDLSKFPSISMVKYENESLWELAKKYHSSIDKIGAFNDTSDMSEKFILIPKEC